MALLDSPKRARGEGRAAPVAPPAPPPGARGTRLPPPRAPAMGSQQQQQQRDKPPWESRSQASIPGPKGAQLGKSGFVSLGAAPKVRHRGRTGRDSGRGCPPMPAAAAAPLHGAACSAWAGHKSDARLQRDRRGGLRPAVMAPASPNSRPRPPPPAHQGGQQACGAASSQPAQPEKGVWGARSGAALARGALERAGGCERGVAAPRSKLAGWCAPDPVPQENAGNDPTVPLVPTGHMGWSKGESDAPPEPQSSLVEKATWASSAAPPPSAAAAPVPAPWERPRALNLREFPTLAAAATSKLPVAADASAAPSGAWDEDERGGSAGGAFARTHGDEVYSAEQRRLHAEPPYDRRGGAQPPPPYGYRSEPFGHDHRGGGYRGEGPPPFHDRRPYPPDMDAPGYRGGYRDRPFYGGEEEHGRGGRFPPPPQQQYDGPRPGFYPGGPHDRGGPGFFRGPPRGYEHAMDMPPR